MKKFAEIFECRGLDDLLNGITVIDPFFIF